MSPVATVALVLVVLVAFFIYRPDRELPFDHLDFSEFLPILQSTESFWERTWGLIGHYARHGRANVLPYALLSAKWEVFGWWSPGWQWSRFVVMVGIHVLVFKVLRRLGTTVLGAVAGSSLFLAAPAAASGWIRLTMGEPLGTLMLLALCLTILPARRLRGNYPRWCAAGLLTAGILLTKEMLAAALVLPFGLLLLTDDDGQLSSPAMSREARQVLLLFSVVGLICLTPMVLIAFSAPSGAYASLYGSATRPLKETVATWLSMLVPIDPVHGLPGPALKAALTLFISLVASGWWLHLRNVRKKGQHAWLLGLSVLLPLIGSITYAPWPAYQLFYAMPFLIGTSILVAFALSAFERISLRASQVAAYGAWGVLTVVAAVGAHWQAGAAAASQRANFRLVNLISSVRGIDSILVATSYTAPQEWQGSAGTLRRYAAALNIPWRPTRDIPCPAGGAGSRSVGDNAVVYHSSLCPNEDRDNPIVERFTRFSLRRLGSVADSVRIDIEIPPLVR